MLNAQLSYDLPTGCADATVTFSLTACNTLLAGDPVILTLPGFQSPPFAAVPIANSAFASASWDGNSTLTLRVGSAPILPTQTATAVLPVVLQLPYVAAASDKRFTVSFLGEDSSDPPIALKPPSYPLQFLTFPIQLSPALQSRKRLFRCSELICCPRVLQPVSCN